MASTRSTNTMAEGLTQLVQQLAALKMTPDADLDFLTAVEGSIIEYARNLGAAAASGQLGMGGMGAGGVAGPGVAGGLAGAGALPQGSVPTAGAAGPPPLPLPGPGPGAGGAGGGLPIPPELIAALGTPIPGGGPA